MTGSPSLPVLAVLTVLAALPRAQHGNDPSSPMYVAPASDEAKAQLSSFRAAGGLVVDLVAAEPDVCNAVAFAIDGRGRCWVAETFRINDGVFDTRNYMQWKDEDLACLTVADRLAKYQRHIARDIPRFAAFSERIRLLVDTDRDGVLDRATVFADGFTDLADGIASGVLAVGDDVWFANIPKLWRLRDRDGDGIADERHAVHDGYGVHTSLIGHDLHGLVVGPDRRLYFSIGDRGFHVEQGDRTFAYPHDGAVLRCELDGSDLEVVHRGLRNPQELAFDAQGDLFTGDNNSDGGDKARLVQIVPGADSGWRIGYQWLDDRGAWNREGMWRPRHAGTPAGILPPIANFADGPAGLAFDPGVGLPERFRGCFFLCDFRGSAATSGVHALRLQRAGAGYELAGTDRVLWHVLATDIDFGPDGSLYVLDWVAGWTKTGKGRIWRVRSPQQANDFLLRATAQVLGDPDLRARGQAALQALLAHPDRRVRQQAQFALVDLDARDALLAAANDRTNRLARLHGIWGLGVLGRRDPAALADVPALLTDGDSDVRAAAARVLGDARIAGAVDGLRQRLADHTAAVQREAALALARLGEAAAPATDGLLDLLRSNDDRDVVLRHAAAFALAAAAPADRLRAALADANPAVRLGSLLALARRGDAAVARCLDDPVPALRAAAARAIYETPIPAAMQALAQLAYDDEPDLDAVDRRAIQANRIVGLSENGEALVHLAALANHPAAIRIEALEVLGEWRTPHGQCRLTGDWRPCEHPGSDIVAQCFFGSLPALLADPAIAATAARSAARLGLRHAGPQLAALVAARDAPDAARLAALDALADLDAAELPATLSSIDAHAPVPLRQRAVALLSRTAPEQAVPVLATLLDDAPLGERQAALEALGELQHAQATAVLDRWLDRQLMGDVPAALQLDLFEAAGRHEALRERRALAFPGADADPTATADAELLARWRLVLEGGDAGRGRKVFFDHEATRCTRCHALGGNGGNAGPALDGIGRQLTREQLLEALLAPSARIAEGFGATLLELHDDSLLLGVVTRDQDGSVTIVSATGEATEVPWTRIRARRANAESAMPRMGGALTKRQVRDLIEFLSRQRRDG
jgi:quinoprotein glucose dehydrogenase